nr:MAG TPA: hypothetical protein [Caudoviricetes sp.]
MTPYEIRLELLKLAFEILKAQETKPEAMPSADDVIVHAEKLNHFVSQKG